MLIGLLHIGQRQPSAQYIAQQLELKSYEIKHIDFTDFRANHSMVEGLSVLIVNMVDEEDAIELILDYLSEQEVPIIFNEAEKSNQLTGDEKSRWLRHILHKISDMHTLLPVNETVLISADGSKGGLLNWGVKSIWILCSGMGGQESVKRFLAAFSNTTNVLFLIVQKIEEEFMLMFSKQMQESLNMKVACNSAEVVENETLSYLLTPGQTIHCEFAAAKMKTTDLDNKSMNNTGANLLALGEHIINDHHMIPNLGIFDGMHDEALILAEMIKSKNGEVLVQAKESCMIQPRELALQALSQYQHMNPEAMAQSIVKAMA